MAKVSFSKLGLKTVNTEIKTVEFNGQEIEVSQYLPIQEKLGLIGRVMEQAHDQDNDFSNPVKRAVIMTLEIIYAYTNISFTDKQKEDPAKLFDLIDGSGLINIIFEAIPDYELNTIEDGVKDSVEAYYAYHNSIVGLMNTLKQEQFNMDFDINKSLEAVKDPEIMSFLKTILTELH